VTSADSSSGAAPLVATPTAYTRAAQLGLPAGVVLLALFLFTTTRRRSVEDNQ
jgi:hypothetical protein